MDAKADTELRAILSGRVQGVGFREFVLLRARMLGLSGYVRNLPDHRSVEVVAEGQRGKLARLLEDLEKGPRLARVDGIDVEWRKAIGSHEGFRVTH